MSQPRKAYEIKLGPNQKQPKGQDVSGDHILQMSARLLLRIKETGGVGDFPPDYLGEAHFQPIDTQEGRRERLNAYYEWLGSGFAYCGTGKIVQRWIADMEGLAIGHVEVSEPASYLIEGFENDTYTGDTVDLSSVMELGRLFVDPNHRRSGIGKQLVETAVKFIVEQDRTPVLVVLEVSKTATQFYQTTGWTKVGTFQGVQGLNLIYTVPNGL